MPFFSRREPWRRSFLRCLKDASHAVNNMNSVRIIFRSRINELAKQNKRESSTTGDYEYIAILLLRIHVHVYYNNIAISIFNFYKLSPRALATIPSI